MRVWHGSSSPCLRALLFQIEFWYDIWNTLGIRTVEKPVMFYRVPLRRSHCHISMYPEGQRVPLIVISDSLLRQICQGKMKCINNGLITHPQMFSLQKLSLDTLVLYVCFIFHTLSCLLISNSHGKWQENENFYWNFVDIFFYFLRSKL